MTQDFGRGEDEFLDEFTLLHNLAVDPGNELQAFAACENLRVEQSRAYRSELVECFSIEELTTTLFWHLEKPAGEIVACAVAEDIGFCLVCRDVTAFPGRNKDELALCVEQVTRVSRVLD